MGAGGFSHAPRFLRGTVVLKQSDADMNNPEQFAAWAFAAGVPDPRAGQWPNQPLIPPAAMPRLSKLLWDLGFRHVAEDQTLWITPGTGPDRNFQTWATTDVMPNAAEMLAEIAPDKAAAITRVTPETHQAALQEAADNLLASIAKLKVAQESLTKGGAAV
jgi:hypothetical protein